jgi:DNA-binding Lrp family transcriptional regulator
VKQDEIARRMKRSRRHVNRALKELEDAGWIQRESGYPGSDGRPGRTTTYRVVIPERYLRTCDGDGSVKNRSHDFVRELCSAIGYEWYNDPNYLKSAAPLVAVVSADIKAGLLNDATWNAAILWCSRDLPSDVRSISGVLYSRYLKWRFECLSHVASTSSIVPMPVCIEHQSVHVLSVNTDQSQVQTDRDKPMESHERQLIDNLGLTFVEEDEEKRMQERDV